LKNEPWLAIDTATEVASVAVGSPEHTAAARSIRGARQHAAQIVPLIREVLALAKVPLGQIAGIIVGDGPGSFTGLRIGWAAAKGLAHERELPLIAIPSLLGFAHAAAGEDARRGRPIAACFDALRGQVFAAIYAFSANRVETLVAPELFTVAALARVTPVRPLLAVGDGAARYHDEIVSWIGRSPVPLETLSPVAGSLLALFSYHGARRAIDDPRVAEPVYGRPAEAQAKWEARYGRPLPHSSR
jgi:tRNA threonylcarbamoyladenosine biosynthesis protein TsaB